MDQLIPAFLRVLRGLADAQELIEAATTLAEGSADSSSVSAAHRYGLLDFPDADRQHENIAASTSLPKDALLKRAAESPGDLTLEEINILKQRYWLDVTQDEQRKQSRARAALLAESPEYWKTSTEQLKQVRSPLYEDNEEQALLNAEMEEWRRGMEAMKQRQREEVESELAGAQPWVRQLWEQDHAERQWGYAAFFDPRIDHDEAEDFEARLGAALMWARDAVGCGTVIGAKWRLQYLDWPEQSGDEGSEEVEDDSDEAGDGKEGEDEGAAETDEGESRAADQLSAAGLEMLRQRFRTIRHSASNKKRKIGSKTSSSGLEHGVLENVFLVITQACVNSVLSSASVDDAWVWAVDPDFEPPAEQSPTELRYNGCLRVRLQQLVHNFFDARRFHEGEHSLEQLWRAAQGSKNQAFVSLKSEEAGMWTMSRDVGSALRPQAAVRYVSLDDL